MSRSWTRRRFLVVAGGAAGAAVAGGALLTDPFRAQQRDGFLYGRGALFGHFRV